MKSKSLQKNITEIKGVGPKVREELNKIGINYIQDALFLLPKKYENRTKLTSIKDLTPGEAFQFEGEILESFVLKIGQQEIGSMRNLDNECSSVCQQCAQVSQG